MNCKEVKILIPDLLREPDSYPEARAHIDECASCRAEMEFVEQLQQGLRQGFPDSSVIENIPARIALIRKMKIEQVRRPLVYALAMAALLILSLILTPLLQQRPESPEFYTYYEEETLETLLSLDLDKGMQLSGDEVILYLIETEPLQTMNELSF